MGCGVVERNLEMPSQQKKIRDFRGNFLKNGTFKVKVHLVHFWATLGKLGQVWENLGHFGKTWATLRKLGQLFILNTWSHWRCAQNLIQFHESERKSKNYFTALTILSLYSSLSPSQLFSLLIFLVRVWTTSCRIMTAVWGRHCLSHRRRRRRPSQASNSRLASRPNYSHHKWIILSATERRRKMTQPWLKIPASFCVFSSFPHDTNQQKLIKA